MKNQKDGFGYNERLFSGGLRTWFHTARFKWVSEKLYQYECPARHVLELGCFDGKIIEYLAQTPDRYVGYDANWENGLDLAQRKYAEQPSFRFKLARSASDIDLREDEIFDLALSMETLEHIDDDNIVSAYLERISKHLHGHLLITVPNEKGIVFATKHLTKSLLSKDAERYTVSEFFNAVGGRMNRVTRLQHKGFDYAHLIDLVEMHFEIVEVSGHPFPFLPPSMCFGIGIVARTKRPAQS